MPARRLAINAPQEYRTCSYVEPDADGSAPGVYWYRAGRPAAKKAA